MHIVYGGYHSIKIAEKGSSLLMAVSYGVETAEKEFLKSFVRDSRRGGAEYLNQY